MLPEQERARTLRTPLRLRSGIFLIETTTVIPPDGGWGWVIVIGSFFCNFVADGILFTSYGWLLADIGESFKSAPTSVAVAQSLLVGFCLLSAPFTCGLINQCGFQTVGFIGGVIAGFAFLNGSLIYSSLYAFIFITGIFGGIGLGMIYLSSVVIVGYYFERWRPLATSIAVTGSAVGIMLLPLILDLWSRCEWRTSFKSITGACFLCTFISLLFRPLPRVRVLTRDGSIVQILETHEESTSSPQEEIKENFFKKCWLNCKKCTDYEGNPLTRDDLYFSSLLLSTHTPRRLTRSSQSHSTAPDARSASVTEENNKACCNVFQPIRNTLREMLNLKLLKSPTYLLLALSGCVSFMGIYIPYLYIHKRADEIGINKKYSHYFYPVMGLSNALGRIMFGMISAIPQVEALMVSYISITISGVATMVSFFLLDVNSLFAYNTIFGLTSACLPCLRTTIIADLFGLEHLTNGFGLIMLFQGLGSLISTPLANACIQLSKTYNAAFMYAGCVLVLSGIMLMPLNKVSHWEYKKEEEELYNTN